MMYCIEGTAVNKSSVKWWCGMGEGLGVSLPLVNQDLIKHQVWLTNVSNICGRILLQRYLLIKLAGSVQAPLSSPLIP